MWTAEEAAGLWPASLGAVSGTHLVVSLMLRSCHPLSLQISWSPEGSENDRRQKIKSSTVLEHLPGNQCVGDKKPAVDILIILQLGKKRQ